MDSAISDTAIEDAVTEARKRFVDAHPGSAGWSDRARRVLPAGNTRSVLAVDPFPVRVVRAEGKHLWDVDGHQYIDLLGNYTAGLLGHSPAPVLDAAREALESGWSLGAVHENEVRLAELLVERFPSIEQVRFTNSGTEANLMALAVVLHHTDRKKIIVFRNGYHGGVITFGAETNPVNVPHDWVLCDYNDAASVDAAFAEHGTEIACVLVEPMQGSGGCIPGDPKFLRSLRSACDAHGALLIFDEVMTSRFSSGGAQQLLGITPDMTTLGKYLAGGLTFGAFGGRADVMAHFDPSRGGVLGHAGTFNNNVSSMAAGVAALTHMLTPEVLDELHARGEGLRTRLNDTLRANGVALTVTGQGSLMNVRAENEALKELFYFHCLEGGWYIARRGFIALSIEVTDADIDAFITHVATFPTTGV